MLPACFCILLAWVETMTSWASKRRLSVQLANLLLDKAISGFLRLLIPLKYQPTVLLQVLQSQDLLELGRAVSVSQNPRKNAEGHNYPAQA